MIGSILPIFFLSSLAFFLSSSFSFSLCILRGINATAVCRQIKKNAPDKLVEFLPKEKIISHILNIIKPRDLVITLGAGDIVKINDELVEELTRQG